MFFLIKYGARVLKVLREFEGFDSEETVLSSCAFYSPRIVRILSIIRFISSSISSIDKFSATYLANSIFKYPILSFCLFYYVDLWNSSSYEEILEEKPLTMDKLDETVFYKLLSVFTESLREFRRFLLKDKNARFKTSINLRDPYVKAVRKMLLAEVVT